MNATPIPTDEQTSVWKLYLLECRDGSLYAGITNNVAARFEAHRQGRGAKYTRSHPPTRIVALKSYPNRSEASKAEYAVKQLPRRRKIAFFQ